MNSLQRILIGSALLSALLLFFAFVFWEFGAEPQRANRQMEELRQEVLETRLRAIQTTAKSTGDLKIMEEAFVAAMQELHPELLAPKSTTGATVFYRFPLRNGWQACFENGSLIQCPKRRACDFTDREQLKASIIQCTKSGRTPVTSEVRKECFTIDCEKSSQTGMGEDSR